MINNNQIQIKELFNNPNNIQKLYVYSVLNFNNDNQALILENTNNTIHIKYLKELQGAYISTALSPQVKVIDEITNSVGLKISTDYVFITNDDCNFLERTKETYFFTVDETITDDTIIYFLGENSIKSFSNMEEEDLKLDQQNLVNLWSLSLQSFDKMNVSKNAKINFKLTNETYDIVSAPEIKFLNYLIKYESLIQTLEIFADLYNDKTKQVKKNVIIDYIFDKKHALLPLMIKYENLNVDSTIRILNFDNSYQLNIQTLESIIKYNNGNSDKNEVFKEIFSLYTDDDTEINELALLMNKLIALSWAFSTNFNKFFDKKNNDFIEYYNSTYANIEPLQYINNIVNDFLYENPKYRESYIFKIFKSLCISMSYFVISPWSWASNNNIYQKTLWWYLECRIPGQILSDFGFNANGSLMDKVELFCQLNIKSDFFNITTGSNDKINNLENINENLTNFNKFNNIISYPYLPNKITEITPSTPANDWTDNNENLKYLTFMCFESKTDLINFLYSLNKSGKPITKTITVDSLYIFNNFNEQQLADYVKPPGSKVVGITNFKKQSIQIPISWKTCEKSKTGFYYKCPKSYKELDDGPDKNGDRWCEVIYGRAGVYDICDMSILTTKKYKREVLSYSSGYRYDATIEIEITSITEPEVYYNKETLINLIQSVGNQQQNTISINIKLSDKFIADGWKIKNINKDIFVSIFNTAERLFLNYVDSSTELLRYKSFQELDNTITKTTTVY